MPTVSMTIEQSVPVDTSKAWLVILAVIEIVRELNKCGLELTDGIFNVKRSSDPNQSRIVWAKSPPKE